MVLTSYTVTTYTIYETFLQSPLLQIWLGQKPMASNQTCSTGHVHAQCIELYVYLIILYVRMLCESQRHTPYSWLATIINSYIVL